MRPLQDTFYVFAFLTVVCAFLTAFFLSRIVGIRLREYPIHVRRELGDLRPASIFSFPWARNRQ